MAPQVFPTECLAHMPVRREPAYSHVSPLPVTHPTGLIHWILNTLHMTIHIREVCVFLAPFFSGLAAVATYLLTSELKDDAAGLLAAAFVGIGVLHARVALLMCCH